MKQSSAKDYPSAATTKIISNIAILPFGTKQAPQNGIGDHYRLIFIKGSHSSIILPKK